MLISHVYIVLDVADDNGNRWSGPSSCGSQTCSPTTCRTICAGKSSSAAVLSCKCCLSRMHIPCAVPAVRTILDMQQATPHAFPVVNLHLSGQHACNIHPVASVQHVICNDHTTCPAPHHTAHMYTQNGTAHRVGWCPDCGRRRRCRWLCQPWGEAKERGAAHQVPIHMCYSHSQRPVPMASKKHAPCDDYVNVCSLFTGCRVSASHLTAYFAWSRRLTPAHTLLCCFACCFYHRGLLVRAKACRSEVRRQSLTCCLHSHGPNTPVDGWPLLSDLHGQIMQHRTSQRLLCSSTSFSYLSNCVVYMPSPLPLHMPTDGHRPEEHQLWARGCGRARQPHRRHRQPLPGAAAVQVSAHVSPSLFDSVL
jgi:hypothetical protein